MNFFIILLHSWLTSKVLDGDGVILFIILIHLQTKDDYDHEIQISRPTDLIAFFFKFHTFY